MTIFHTPKVKVMLCRVGLMLLNCGHGVAEFQNYIVCLKNTKITVNHSLYFESSKKHSERALNSR